MTSRTRASFECIAVALAAVAAVGVAGCETGSDRDKTDGWGFISDNPNGASQNGGDNAGDSGSVSSGTGSGSGAGGGGGSSNPGSEGDPERAIVEADIIQVHEGKLYALSQYSGLSIVDISVPDQLTLLGRYEGMSGMPFEMYLRGNVVYAMFSSWGQYIYDASSGTYSWVQTSHIEALDITNPAAVTPLGSFDLPGAISDSRIVGDVLYAVTFEDGYCWDCDPTPNTTITSISVASPTAISVVDQESFADNDPYGYGWRRSVSATNERMYVAGIEWDGGDYGHSTIQVVDISDPSGQLVLGASVEAEGQIQSRWQMDEYEGVLRVISQPGIWWSDAMPAVQTFAVASSQSITPLGYTELELPMPETLRSVRFDGPRGYAITAQQTDPLFTIDLSDPAQPMQMGELEMPGWIYHMEPRGDRLLALGFDNTDPEGALNVSLFNVADMTQPAMIKRVGFGGEWSNLAEDQDRIHKAFSILDELGLILVPYAGWSYDDIDSCGSYHSGIQLIDFTADSLTKRGVADSRGQARRAFIHDARLFSVSDEEVRTFNIANRDAPQKTADLGLASVVSQSAVAGNIVVRLSADWWTTAARLEVVPSSNPAQMEPLGTLDLSSLAEEQNGCYSWGVFSAKLFAHGQHAYLAWPSDDWTKMRFTVIDLTDPTSPALAGQIELPIPAYDLFGGYYGPVVSSGDPIVQVGSTLVLRRVEADPYYYGGYEGDYADGSPGGFNDPASVLRDAWLEVVDLSNPAQPAHAATVKLPEAAGHTGLRVDGTQVMLSHWVPLSHDSTKARFYLDRIDVANPASPDVLGAVNVPGSLLSLDSDAGRLLTVDYRRQILPHVDATTCWEQFGYDASWAPEDQDQWEGPGTCSGMQRSLKLVQLHNTGASLLEVHPMEQGTSVWSVLVGDDRVYLPASNYAWYDESEPYWNGTRLLVIGGIADGALEIAEMDGEELGYLNPAAADGTRLILSSWGPTGIWTLDTADMDALAFEQKGELRSYPYHVTVSGDLALCSMGSYGLTAVDLAE